MAEKIPPEISFVLLCACSNPGKEHCDMIKNAANHVLDWNAVYKIAQNHRILPLLYINIKNNLHDRVDADVSSRLKRDCVYIAARSLYFSSVLNKIIALFRMHNIKVLPLKGPVVAKDLYGDAGIRVFSDLDILVEKYDAEKAWAVFLENGFQPELNLNANQFRKFIRYEDNISFLNKSRNVSIELHWEMSGFYLSKPLRFNHVEKNFRKISINKTEISNLSEEHLLIFLCIHGAKHGWEHLEQVCCVAEIIRKKNINWGIVNQAILDWQCRRMVYLGLYLSWDLLMAPIPGLILDEIKKDKKIPVLANKVITSMFNKSSDHTDKDITNRFSSFHIEIRDKLSDKFKYIFRLIFCPTNEDWKEFPLPAGISFFHFVLRPCRLILAGLKNTNA